MPNRPTCIQDSNFVFSRPENCLTGPTFSDTWSASWKEYHHTKWPRRCGKGKISQAHFDEQIILTTSDAARDKIMIFLFQCCQKSVKTLYISQYYCIAAMRTTSRSDVRHSRVLHILICARLPMRWMAWQGNALLSFHYIQDLALMITVLHDRDRPSESSICFLQNCSDCYGLEMTFGQQMTHYKKADEISSNIAALRANIRNAVIIVDARLIVTNKWKWVVSVACTLTHIPLDKMATILADDIFKCILLYENDNIPIQLLLKLVPRSPLGNELILDQVMVWRQTDDKPLPEPMMTQIKSLTLVWKRQHISDHIPQVTSTQWHMIMALLMGLVYIYTLGQNGGNTKFFRCFICSKRLILMNSWQ